ncbi:MAG: BMP family ABC transporter substrate-binding protein [Lautropia sp.]|nr:BMP family ABC transporter substrate-binding protein [Lautropia sp.]
MALALTACDQRVLQSVSGAVDVAASSISGVVVAASAGQGNAAPVAEEAIDGVAEPAEDALKVAFVYPSSADRSAWAMAHEEGRKALVEAMDGKVYASLVENVADADAEQTMRDLIEQGNRLIFATSPAYRDVVIRLAREYPDVRWEVIGSGAPATVAANLPDNLRFYEVRAYEGAYLAGVVAGRMTKTDTLGFIASVPVPEVIRNIDAYALGAQSVNPSARVKVAWVNAWTDSARETEAAQSLIDSGADVLLSNTGSSSPLKVAERAGKYAFGWASDMSMVSSKSHLGSVVFDWGKHYTRSTEQLVAGRWRPTSSWTGLKEGSVALIELSGKLPPDVRAQVEERRKAIADGKFRIWKGPLVSSDDRVLLASDKVADDRFVAGLMTYVKGVEGQIPAVR